MSEPWIPAGPALLFVPADRPDRYQKAAAAADVVIVDLEDAVAPDRKEQARQALAGATLDPSSTIVRVNPDGTDDQAADLACVSNTAYRVLMLAKTEDPQQVRALAQQGYHVIALLETARGVVHAREIAAEPGCVALMWGSEDLMASIGGVRSRRDDGSYRSVPTLARATVALAAGAYGRAMIDAVYMNIPDLDGLRAEAEDGAAQGFCGTACIHPSQVPVVRQAYTPPAERVAWAKAILAAAHHGAGVSAVDGQMIDGPLFRQAQTVLRRSGADLPGQPG